MPARSAWHPSGRLSAATVRRTSTPDFDALPALEDGRVAIGKREPFVQGEVPDALTNRLSREFTPSRDAAYVVIGVYDQPLRPELEVVVDGIGELGLR